MYKKILPTLVITLALTFTGCSQSIAPEPDNTPKYIGLTSERAMEVAKEQETMLRIVEINGEPQPTTMDYRPGRINAATESGIITSYTIEGEDGVYTREGKEAELPVNTTTQSENEPEAYTQESWKNIIDESCTAFSDGCNTCVRIEGSEEAGCTRKFCEVYREPICLDEDQGGAALSETYTIFVASELVDCVGVGPMECMRTRKAKSEPWTNFYDEIKGFTYEEGYEYTLKISRMSRENPPADASAYTYELIEVIAKEKPNGELPHNYLMNTKQEQ